MTAPSVSLVKVPFREGHLLAARAEGQVLIPIRPVTDALGLTMQSQLPKLRSKPWATIREILMVAEDGKTREMACLNLQALPLWLATIDTSKVKPEVRPALLALQTEACDVLYRHFLAPPSDDMPACEGRVMARPAAAKARRPAVPRLAAKPLPRPAASTAMSLAHLETAEATLEALAHLSDAQDTARRLSALLRGGLDLRELPDAQDDARDLELCLGQLAGELGRCCHRLTGREGGYRPRSLVNDALDLAAVVAGLRAQLRPEGDEQERSIQAQLAAHAARSFGPVAQGGA